MNDSILRLAIFQAEKVNILDRSNNRFRLGAVLFRKNNVISVGHNYYSKTHPASPSPFKHLHAEADCLLGVPQYLFSGAELLVVRLDPSGQLRIAKPCKDCFGLISSTGIRKLHYSTNEGKLESIKI